MTTVIYGADIAKSILQNVKAETEEIKHRGLSCSIAILLVGNNPSSQIYVNNKILAAKSVGINPILLEFNKDISTASLVKEIQNLNVDSKISGIIVQLPLPNHINVNIVMAALNPEKDVDGFHPSNVGMLHIGIEEGFVPCTALGCLEIIKHCTKTLLGKQVAVVGRSNIVGSL